MLYAITINIIIDVLYSIYIYIIFNVFIENHTFINDKNKNKTTRDTLLFVSELNKMECFTISWNVSNFSDTIHVYYIINSYDQSDWVSFHARIMRLSARTHTRVSVYQLRYCNKRPGDNVEHGDGFAYKIYCAWFIHKGQRRRSRDRGSRCWSIS